VNYFLVGASQAIVMLLANSFGATTLQSIGLGLVYGWSLIALLCALEKRP
jgi:hypothetical protein